MERAGDAEKAAAARSLNGRQKYYDLLHHRKRAETLKHRPRLDFFQRGLLRQSERILRDPSDPCGSVDLADCRYLHELDRYAEKSGLSASPALSVGGAR